MKPQLRPAPDFGPLTYWKSDDVSAEAGTDTPKRIAIFGDMQGTHLDPRAWALFLARVRSTHFDELICDGDALDFPTLSKFGPNPRMDVLLQTEIDFTGMRLRELSEAAGPGTKKKLVPGNHSQRLELWLAANASQFALLTRSGETGRPVLSLENLLRLDEIGVEYVRSPKGLGYPQATYVVKTRSGESVGKVIHGQSVSKGAGMSVRKEIDRHRCNVWMGHVHRDALVWETHYTVDGEAYEVFGSEVGGMCNRDPQMLGYGVNPDWQLGWDEAYIYDDKTVVPVKVRIMGNRAFTGSESWSVDPNVTLIGQEDMAA